MVIEVKVEFLSYLANFIGSREIQIQFQDAEPTIKALLEELKKRYPEKFPKNFLTKDDKLQDNIVLLLNGRTLKQYEEKYPDPYTVPLGNGDEVVFLIPFGGG